MIELKNYPKWFITENGELYSIARGTLKKLKGYMASGYRKVEYHLRGKREYCFIHRLVAEAFLDKVEGCDVVNHIDGNKLNNHVSNLEWVTYSENSKHAQENNLTPKPPIRYGSKNNKSILAEYQIKTIRKMFADGMSNKEIAEYYGVSRDCIYDIRTGRSWSWLK